MSKLSSIPFLVGLFLTSLVTADVFAQESVPAAEPAADEIHEVRAPCYVYALIISRNAYGYPCASATAGPMSHPDGCEAARAAALAAARAKIPAGCTEEGYEVRCYPQEYCNCCDERTTMKAAPTTQCAYQVTYKIVCCDGHVIIQTETHPLYFVAKQIAKDIACFRAQLECAGRIRCCRCTYRRVWMSSP